MVHRCGWLGRSVRSTRMVASGWCVSCFFVGSEFVDLLSHQVFSGVFPMVGFSQHGLIGMVGNFLLLPIYCYATPQEVQSGNQQRVYKYFI